MNGHCLLPSLALLPAVFSKKDSWFCVVDSKISLTALGDSFYHALTKDRIARYFVVNEMAWILSWKMF